MAHIGGSKSFACHVNEKIRVLDIGIGHQQITNPQAKHIFLTKMATSHHDAIQTLVHKINETILSRVIDNPSLTITPSAYDTAWVAMIGDRKDKQEKPLFSSCLEWILNNQKPEGFWGERDYHGNPTIDSLPTTLACMVALKTWNLGSDHIERGMAFINTNSTRLLKLQDVHNVFPQRFAMVFPSMVELARCTDLQVIFDEEVKEVVARVLRQQQEILTSEEVVDSDRYPPLLSCLEVLPPTFPVGDATLLSKLSGDGSLFRSPSATAAAFMATRNSQMLPYLHHLVQNFNGGVPSMYPIDDDDEDYIPINMVDQLQRLGLSKLFPNQINCMLENILREYNAHKPSELCGLIPADIYKSSLAFQLLRLHGYKVSARKFCWFLNDANAMKYIEENYKKFATAIYSLYRATYLMFESEEELHELRSFTRKLLVKSTSTQNVDDGIILCPHLQEKIKCELAVPWLARMDHLEHRNRIELANQGKPIWLGKSSKFRLSCLDDEDLLQLATHDFEFRQQVYQKELEELIRWSKIYGLMDMGFAREKTSYCYFAVASASSLPYDSDVRVIAAKSAVLVTVFDDYFDMEGSLDELQILANAVKRWDNKGLHSHSRILFDALDNFVSEIANKYFDQYGLDIIENIRKLWYEVVGSWLTEARWSKTGHIPSMASYLETGMISIAAHLMVLQASCFVTPSLSPHKLNPSKYHDITKLLMISCRLLNDLQSYEREAKDGKINSVYLYMRENPEANMEDAIGYVENILEKTKMKLLELALIDGNDAEELPKPCKMLHLAALKVFQMFFNSMNHFDSKDSLLNDINKAIFTPLEPRTIHPRPKKPRLVINSCNKINMMMRYHRTSKPIKPYYRGYCTSSPISAGSHLIPLIKVYSSKV
ncbi:S-linalool synthase [Spinacia oleracea]|uniref:S-linalool synthase n=1 Tax=Spinacia oleracea TaxID=3562 RepID=A0A9R0IDU6_SPIOL|nr:S-linalool synthase [Spinacia oleracea]